MAHRRTQTLRRERLGGVSAIDQTRRPSAGPGDHPIDGDRVSSNTRRREDNGVHRVIRERIAYLDRRLGRRLGELEEVGTRLRDPSTPKAELDNLKRKQSFLGRQISDLVEQRQLFDQARRDLDRGAVVRHETPVSYGNPNAPDFVIVEPDGDVRILEFKSESDDIGSFDADGIDVAGLEDSREGG